MTAPKENGEGAFLAMKKALKNAHLPPSAVDYVNAHATSTIVGDAAENAAIKTLLLGPGGKQRASEVNISSTKGAVGHLLGGAGAIEAVFSVLAIHEVGSFIFPFPNCSWGCANGDRIPCRLRSTCSVWLMDSTVIMLRTRPNSARSRWH